MSIWCLAMALLAVWRQPEATGAEIAMAKGEQQTLRAMGEFMDPAGQPFVGLSAEMILPAKRQAELKQTLATYEHALAVERLQRQALALQDMLHREVTSTETLASLEYNLRALVETGPPWTNVQRLTGLLVAALGYLQHEERWPEERMRALAAPLRTLILAKFPPLGDTPLTDLYTLPPDQITPPLRGALAPLAQVPVAQRPVVARLIAQLVDAPSEEAIAALETRLETATGDWRASALITAETAETLLLTTRTIGALTRLRLAAGARLAETLQALERDFPEYHAALQRVREQARPDALEAISTMPTQSSDITSLVHWISSNPDAVIMNGNQAVFTGEGSSGITASLGYINSLPEQALTRPPYLLRLEINPLRAEIEQGHAFTFQVRGIYSDQQAHPVREGLTWFSRTPAIAAVGPDGTVHGLRLGRTEIAAVSGMRRTLPAQVRVTYPLRKRLLQWLSLLLAVLTVIGGWLYARRRAGERRLAALQREDPRRFIIAIYHLLARQWGWLGLPRKPSMIPEEYAQLLQVKFGETALAALQTMTALFLRAQYSRAPLDAAHGLEMAQTCHGLTTEICGRLPGWQRLWLWMRGGMLRLSTSDGHPLPH